MVGTALAGKAWQGTVRAGECVKIMTGAIMPAGLDTVVPQELRATAGRPHHRARRRAAAGRQPAPPRRRRDAGQPALLKGERLTPAALGLLASLGIETAPVVRRLKVAYFSTGDEILSLGEPPREGAVYDSNRYTVFGLLTRLGCEVIDLGVVRDDPALLEAAFLKAAAQADAIITSGGVSVGEADFTKAMMKKLGDVAFWRIAMRPGRPMAVGRISQAKSASSPRGMDLSSSDFDINQHANGAILFGLPGNPVAVMVTFLAFVRPALLRMMGARTARRRCSRRAASRPSARNRAAPNTSAARSHRSPQAPEVSTTGNQGSGVLSSMVQANGLIVLHHAQGNVAAGDEVDVMMFDGVI